MSKRCPCPYDERTPQTTQPSSPDAGASELHEGPGSKRRRRGFEVGASNATGGGSGRGEQEHGIRVPVGRIPGTDDHRRGESIGENATTSPATTAVGQSGPSLVEPRRHDSEEEPRPDSSHAEPHPGHWDIQPRPLPTSHLLCEFRYSVDDDDDFDVLFHSIDPDSDFENEYDITEAGSTESLECQEENYSTAPRTQLERHLDNDPDLGAKDAQGVADYINVQDAAVEAELQVRKFVLEPFDWHGDFMAFRSKKETFSGTPGPTEAGRSDDPLQCFLNIWDEEIMSKIVEETNKYGAQVAAKSTASVDVSVPKEGRRKATGFKWKPTYLAEMYNFFRILLMQSINFLGNEKEYFYKKIKGAGYSLGDFIPYNRFVHLKRCLHFADNEQLEAVRDNLSVNERCLFKIYPIVKHCTKKFQELYNLDQNIAIGESLTLWKGKLSFGMYIKTKGATFGIKSFELCESATGYLYDVEYYTGKSTDTGVQVEPDVVAGIPKTGVAVMKLMEKLLNKGHVLHMDNSYNCPRLARYLKANGTDCVGTLQCRRKDVPLVLKETIARNMSVGELIGFHSGDVSMVSWMDERRVTMISTYHCDESAVSCRAGKPKVKPVVVLDYNINMGGVNLKDQRLSSFLMERKRNLKWYMKVFKRLLNTSIINSYIIYCASTVMPLNHRDFRYALVDGLGKFVSTLQGNTSQPDVTENPTVHPNIRLDQPNVRAQTDCIERPYLPMNHSPVYNMKPDGTKRRMHCILCTFRKARQGRQEDQGDQFREPKRVRQTLFVCNACNKPLCVPECFYDFHHTKED